MLRILFLLLAVFIGGWVAWPAYSAYQIYGGMQSADTGLLERKIDWDSMRTSLRPAVASEVEKAMGGGAKGLTGALMPQIIDAALKAVVTPKGLAQVMAHGGDVSSAVSEIVSKQAGKLGGLGALAGGGDSGGGGMLGKLLGGGDKGGSGGILGGLLGNKKVREMAGDKLGGMMKKKEPEMADKPSTSSSPSYGLANIKRFAYTGIGTMEVGVAKDPAIDTSDVTAIMEFRDFDWKLTGLVPRSK